MKEKIENNNIEVKNENNPFLQLIDVNKVYPNGVQAVFNFHLDVNRQDFVALVGPSGCGKTTTLRMIAGLEEISSGSLIIDNKVSNYVQSRDRDIAMVFQSYALYPHLSVYDNLSFGLVTLKTPKDEIQERVFKAASILNLGPYLDRKPKELSGGQMQRVALGRAIVRQARLFLMDEPLSNLDAKLRMQTRTEIVRIHEETKATTIYVTHDQTEAMTMANKIVVMNKGFVQQIGEPMEVYNHPQNIFVASFIGAPPMNLIEATYDKGEIIFKNGFKIKASEDFVKQYDDFYIKKIETLNALLSENIEALKNYQLLQRSHQLSNENDEKVVQKKDKVNIFQKIAKKIDHNRQEQNIEEEKQNIIAALHEEIADSETRRHEPSTIKFGIRPEDIYLSNAVTEAKLSELITIDAEIVEPLGSEYIVYAKFIDERLIIKLSAKHRVKSHAPIEVKFNLDKMHIFDPNSGEAIR